jgi:hypothetical protein
LVAQGAGRQHRADDVDRARTEVGDVLDQADLRQDHGDDDHLEEEADAPRQEGRDETTDKRADRGSDFVQSLERGLAVIRSFDGNASLTDEEHAASLNNFLIFFGDVMTTDEAIGRLVPVVQRKTA